MPLARLVAAAAAGSLLLAVFPGRAAGQAIVPRGEPIAINYTANYDAPGGRPGVAAGGDTFLTVWKDTRNQATHGRDPWAARTSRDGVVLDPNGIRLSTSTNDVQWPSVAFDGTYYLVVWTSSSNGTSGEIFGSIVGTDGTLVASDIPITTTGNAYFRVVSIAYDGTNFLIAWRTATHHIRAIRVRRTGGTLTSLDGTGGFPVTSTTADYYPWVTFGHGQYFVAWHSGRSPSPGVPAAGLDIYAARISTAGVVLDPNGIAVAVSADVKDHVSVAASDANFIVTYRDQGTEDAYRNARGYAKRVSPAGAVLDASPILIAEDVHWGSMLPIVFDGTNYVAIYQVLVPHNWRYIDLMGRRISPTGAAVDPTPFPVAASFAPQGWLPMFAYGDNRYLAAWDDHGRDYLCAQPACLAGQVFEKLPSVPPVPAASHDDAVDTPSADSGWLPVASPYGGALHGVDAVDDATAYIGTDGSYPMRYINGSWAQWAGSSQGTDLGVWANGPSDVLFAGWTFSPKRFDGASWFWQNLDPQRGLAELAQGMWSSGRNNLFVVGTQGRAIRYDGTNWIADPTGVMLDLWDVWGTSTSNVYAVGENGLVLHWDGTAWRRMADVPSRQNLNAIWGTSATDIFVVGDFGTILHYDGAQWTALASGTTKHLTGVSGLSPTAIFASGFGGTILRYNGVTWQSENSGTATNLLDVGVGGNTVWAVGDSGVIRRNVIDAAHCARSLDRTAVAVAAAGGVESVTLTTNCTWRTWSHASWIVLNSSSNGTGGGTASFTVLPNPSASPRTGMLTVGTQLVTITQAGATGSCSYSLNPMGASYGAQSAAGTVGVTASSGSCQWGAQSNASWLSITSSTPVTGNGQVGYSVQSNASTTPRTGTLTVAGQTFTVTQAGSVTPGCSFTLNLTSANHGPAATSGSVTVTASQSSCQWAAQSHASWLSIASPMPVTGSGTLGYSVLANGSTAPRSGTLTVAGQSVTVTQDGAPATLQAPVNLVAAVTGSTVSASWTMPASAVTPTGFVLEGGLTPGSVLASLPTGSAASSFTVNAPNGVFYIRMHALAGSTRSGPSNEVRIAVGVPVPPAAPADLVGEAFGSNLALWWRNPLNEGPPTAIVLDVSGAVNLSIPLPLSSSFAFSGVPPGIYTLAVRAVNGSGSSARSNPITLTFPAQCVAAGTPANFTAARTGNVISVSWSRPPGGPTPAGYVVVVTGTLNTTIPLAQTSIAGAVPPGSYTISVMATHPCGAGQPTAPQTVVVP